jgi:hypothetical protein
MKTDKDEQARRGWDNDKIIEPEASKKKRSGVFIFDRKGAIKEAENYGCLNFLQETKNIIITIIVAGNIVSIFLMQGISFGQFYADKEALIGVVSYFIFLPFIYLNYRWALILLCVLYVSDRLIFLFEGAGSPVMHLIFSVVAIKLTYQAVLTATHLKAITRGSSLDATS